MPSPYTYYSNNPRAVLTLKEQREMYRLMRRVHRLTATRAEQNRYRVLSRQTDAARNALAEAA